MTTHEKTAMNDALAIHALLRGEPVTIYCGTEERADETRRRIAIKLNINHDSVNAPQLDRLTCHFDPPNKTKMSLIPV